MIDLNQIINAALTDAIEQAVKPLRNQIQYLAEEVVRLRSAAPQAEVDFTSEAFIAAVDAAATTAVRAVLSDISSQDNEGVELELTHIIDSRIDRQIGKLADVPNFNQSVRDVVGELFSDEGRDLISEHVESVIEDYDFSDKLDDIDFDDKVRNVLKYNLSLSVTVD